MRIARLNELKSESPFIKQFPQFTLIVGKSSDPFDYYGVEEMHGLKKSECYDTKTDAYIAGLCNVNPNNSNEIFLFLNKIRFNSDHKDLLLIMHETMHLSLELWGHNLQDGDLEEKVITWAETTADTIYLELKSQNFI